MFRFDLLATDRVYWTDRQTGRIERAGLDGSDRTVLLAGVVPAGIAVDRLGARIYWTEQAPARIRRAGLDGGQIEDLVTVGLVEPDDIEHVADTINGFFR